MGPVAAVPGSHQASCVVGQVPHGGIWAKPRSWSCPGGFFCQCEVEPCNSFLAQLSFTGVRTSSTDLGSDALRCSTQFDPLWSGRGCSGASTMPARARVMLSLLFLLPLAT